MFHLFDHLTSVIVSCLGLDVIELISALANSNELALNDSSVGLSHLNKEVKLMQQTVLQNCMALDILSVEQGDTCANIKAECCIYS